MIRWFISILTILLLSVSSVSQQLLVLPEHDEPDHFYFNEHMIQRNRIAAIHGEVSAKREGEPIHQKKEHYLYKFDAAGRTVYRNTSYGTPGSGMDTASTILSYDQRGRATNKLRNDLNGHFTHELEYDSEGRVTRQTYARVENLTRNRYTLKPGRRTMISDEYFKYQQLSDTVTKITYLNHLQLPYRERKITTDANGYVKRFDDRYTVSNRRSEMKFQYDEKGRLTERTYRPNLLKKKSNKYTYEYDTADNLVAGTEWRNGKKVKLIEYLYDDKTMLLSAKLTKSVETQLIDIVQFTYEYQQ